MMIPGANSCYSNEAESTLPIYGISSLLDGTNSALSDPAHVSNSFLYNLSVLKDKIRQVESLATAYLSPYYGQSPESSTMGTLIQEIIVTASSMMFTCQQMAFNSTPLVQNTSSILHNDRTKLTTGVDALHEDHTKLVGHTADVLHEERTKLVDYNTDVLHEERKKMVDHDMNVLHKDRRKMVDHNMDVLHEESMKLADVVPLGQSSYVAVHVGDSGQPGFFSNEPLDNWRVDGYNNQYSNKNSTNNDYIQAGTKNEFHSNEVARKRTNDQRIEGLSRNNNYDIVELNAADLLAKYTHYCQVCGKGFKRDANLRMHMRAHGDEYKSSAALSNPLKKSANVGSNGTECDNTLKLPRKYSCPQEGCRWNKKHAKFQPLKSMICVKNHYKRSHCPKMYVCKRCNRKQFSVLSDLRTHEKHCGDLKWQCSCGNTFSRKDKLMGHLNLFIGHSPAVTLTKKMVAGSDTSALNET